MRVESNVNLSERTTLRLGGPAKNLVTVESETELATVAAEARAKGEELFVLGGGSNLVIADAGANEPMVTLGLSQVTFEATERAVRVRVQAGHDWDALVEKTIAEGLSGLECLSGIPGSVGATPIQNVGAYGQEVADTIVSVRVFDQVTETFAIVPRAECEFAYRHSRFRNQRRIVVTEVEFELRQEPTSRSIRYAELAKALGIAQGDVAPLRRVRDTVIALRRGKGMVWDKADPESTSAGSFFTNPLVTEDVALRVDAIAGRPVPRFPSDKGRVKLPAAWLVEAAGFEKGFALGKGASISKKHALALVNRGGTTADLLELARAIQRGVEQRFGVRLEPEPIFVGCAL